MKQHIYLEIIRLAIKAQKLAKSIGIENLFQPGLVKEMIIANHLKHKLITSKRDADACAFHDASIKYEYLSCKEGGSGQFDRMYSYPKKKRQNSLNRITRNHKIYIAVFFKKDQLKVKTIYEINPQTMLRETVRQLDISINNISHVAFKESWAKKNGKIVYFSKDTK